MTPQRPAVHDATALDKGIPHRLEYDIVGIRLADIVVQVNQQVTLPFPGERVPMDTGTRGRREFHVDTRIRETDAVIARRRHLVVVRKGHRSHFKAVFPDFHFADGRREQEITEVRTARTGKVRMGKSHDGLVAPVIAAAAVPGPVPGVRAQLDHARRGGGPGIGMPMEIGPHKGIRLFHGRFLIGTTSGRQHQGGDREKICAHNQSVLAFWLHANITNKRGNSD